MKTALLCLIALSVVASTAFTQPDTLWTRTFGGSSFDEGKSVRQTTDGGYVVTGFTYSYGAGSEDVFLLKTDSMGYRQWACTFGGNYQDEGWSVQQTTDGGYIIAGKTYSHNPRNANCLLIKTNTIGELQWYRTLGGTGCDAALSVQQCTDGGYIITGYSDWYGASDGDVLVIKTDSIGNQQWNRIFGGRDNDVGYGAQQTTDGGYIIVGKTRSYGAGNYDVWLIKTDPTGHQQWNRTFGSDYSDFGSGVQQTVDGGYIIIGSSYDVLGDDVRLIKTDTMGNQQWNRTFGEDEEHDWGASVQQTTDGGYIITGGTSINMTSSYDVLLMKTDSTGTMLWNLRLGDYNSDYGNSVQQTTDGGYIIAGTTHSYGAGATDVWLIRVAAEASPVIDRGHYQPSEFTFFPPYPNPFNPTTTISYHIPARALVKVDIYNVLGQHITTLLNQIKDPGHHHLTWNATEIPSGIYFCRMSARIPMGQAGSYTQIQKLVLLR